jgi:flagellar basal-body rod protein FlgB
MGRLMIESLTNSESIPVLERMMQFTGQRQRIIANNVANMSTPGFRPSDVSVEDFQAQLGSAVKARRVKSNSAQDGLSIESTREVVVHDDGMTLRPSAAAENLLFHDQNDRDVERIMQDLVENFMAFRTAAQFLRSRFDLINTAIRERV